MIPGWLNLMATQAVRGFPLVVLVCVLIFPAFKGMPLGYVPVGCGLLLAGMVWRFHLRITEWAIQLSTPTFWVGILGLPALIQVSMILLFRPAPSFDGLFVVNHAVTLVATGIMDPMTYYPPAQTWWYGLWFLPFGSSALVAQLSQIPLSLGVTWATYRLAHDVGGPSVARLSAIAVAWYPSFLGYALTTPYYHYLYTFLTVVMVWMLVRSQIAKPVMGWLVGAGMVAGLGALTKAVQLIAPLQALTAWIVWEIHRVATGRHPSWGGAVKSWTIHALWFSLGMILVVGPWTYRNTLLFGDIVPVCTSGGLVLYSANNPESNGLYSPTPDQVDLSTPEDMLAHSRWCSEQAKTFMREMPGAFANLMWRKFLHTWGSEATFTELINWRGENPPWIKQGFSFVFLTGWAACVGLWAWVAVGQIRRREPLSFFELLTGVILLSNAVVYVVFEGGDRHHLPFVPLVVVLIATLLPANSKR